MPDLLLKFLVPLEERQVVQLRQALENCLKAFGLPEDTVYRVTTVVDELFCNAMEHSGAHWVEVGAAPRGADVAVALRDDGVPFDPWEAGRKDYSLYLESNTDRHLGLYLVTRLAREVTYSREAGVNQVRFVVGKVLPDPLNPLPRAVETGGESA